MPKHDPLIKTQEWHAPNFRGTDEVEVEGARKRSQTTDMLQFRRARALWPQLYESNVIIMVVLYVVLA